MPFMVMNQRIHKYSVTGNFQQFTSNPGPILPKPVLLFRISWVYLTIMTLVIVMLGFSLYIIYFSLPLTLFQIRNQLWSNQFMMVKWTNSWNYSTQIMMIMFWDVSLQMLQSWIVVSNYIKHLYGLYCVVS